MRVRIGGVQHLAGLGVHHHCRIGRLVGRAVITHEDDDYYVSEIVYEDDMIYITSQDMAIDTPLPVQTDTLVVITKDTDDKDIHDLPTETIVTETVPDVIPVPLTVKVESLAALEERVPEDTIPLPPSAPMEKPELPLANQQTPLMTIFPNQTDPEKEVTTELVPHLPSFSSNLPPPTDSTPNGSTTLIFSPSIPPAMPIASPSTPSSPPTYFTYGNTTVLQWGKVYPDVCFHTK